LIRYTYNTQVNPPAPFVLITLRNPAGGAEVRDVPAQIDTARTAPWYHRQWPWRLHVWGRPRLRVIASPSELWVLLGGTC
jgi:hypothetical protein